MADLFFRNRQLLVLSILLIVVAGLSAFRILPRREDPELTPRWSTILTMYPGASAERVDALVTEKVEEALRELDEIEVLRSSSRPGASLVSVELRDEVVDIQPVWSKIRDRLEEIHPTLPARASAPVLDDKSQGAFTFLAALVWHGDGDAPLGVMRRLAKDLEDRMRVRNGSEFVKTFGAPVEEVRVEFSAADMAGYGLTPRQVAQAIERTDAKVTAGRMRSPTTNLSIEVAGELSAIESIRRIPVRRGTDGQATTIGDIATVVKGVAEPPQELALMDGRRGVAVGVRMGPGQRVDRWVETLRADLAPFVQSLPPDIHYEVLFDQSTYTRGRLDELLTNLALGGLMVVLVMFFMMGWRAALVVGLSLPLSSLMVLAGMWFLGIPIHQMSVTGLILSLGLLIDNAIILVDEVSSRLRRGDTKRDAITASVRHLAAPLLGSTATTILAFLPIALLPGGSGEFVSAIALSVMLALVSSFLLAMTVIPALSGIFGASHGRAGWWREGFHSRTLVSGYRRVLDFLLAWPRLTMLAVVLLAAVGFMRRRDMVEQFFPAADRDQFTIVMHLPHHAGIDETSRITERAREIIRRHAEVTRVSWYVGNSAPQVYYNMIGNQKGAANFAQGIVTLANSEHTTRVIRELQTELTYGLPSAAVVVRQFEQGPPFNAPIELRIFGPDAEVLNELGDRVRLVLSEVPDVTRTRTTLSMGMPHLEFVVEDEAMRRAGLDNVTIADELDAALEGYLGGSILEGSEELPVRVRLSDREREDMQRIRSFNIARIGTDGEMGWLPLSAVGELRLEPQVATLARRDGRLVNTVQGYLTAGVLPAKVLADFSQRIESAGLEIPEGYTVQFGGEQAKRNDSVEDLMASVGLIVTLMGTVLVLTFRSFRIALLIAFVGLLAIGMGLFALWGSGFPFGFMAIIGTMGLVGIAINDTIVVLAALDASPEARSGDPTAIREVVVHASRHVLSTTITTMAGFTPLVLGGGGFWPPLAIAIAGGVAGATLMALTLAPAAFLVLHGRAASAVRIRSAGGPAPDPTGD